MTWTNIAGTTTISASRAVTLPVRFRSEPIKILALHPGSGIGGTLTIWDENGRSVQVTRLDPNQSRYEAEFYSDVDGFNYSFAADGNGVVASPGISVYLVSRPAADPDIVNSTIVMSGPVQAPGLRLSTSSDSDAWVTALPDGTIAMSGPVISAVGGCAPNTLRGRGLKMAIFGSSSAAACSEPLRANYLTSSANIAERVDGFLFAALADSGLPLQIVWNGGYANETTAQIIARYKTDIVDGNYPGTDIEAFLLFANDFPAGTTLASLKQSVYSLIHSVLGRGKKFVLIVPHTRNPSPVTHTEYIAAHLFGKQLEGEFPNQVRCVSHYEAASPLGQDTPSTWLKDGLHLNSLGVAGVATAWRDLSRSFGSQIDYPPRYADFGGNALAVLTGANMTSLAGVTVEQVADHVDARGARPQWRLTSSADVAEILMASTAFASPVAAGMQIRLWADLTVETVGAATQYYHAGALFRGAGSASYQRFGCSSSIALLQLHPGRLIRGVSRPFTAQAAHETGTLGVRAGNSGSSVLLREVALIQVPEL